MKKIVAVFVLAVLSSGCATYNFTSSTLAKSKGQIASASMLGKGVDPQHSGKSAKKILENLGNDSKVEKVLATFQENCKNPPPEIKAAPGIIPIISVIPKIIYDIAADKTDRKLVALKKSASSSYSVDFVIPKDKISDFQCVIVLRNEN